MANISVIVPTYRSRNLAPTIAALRDQRGVSLQVIVVENGSNTLAAQSWFADAVRAGNIRHEILETPNLNGARNAGVRLASAPVIAFTDDDCVPSRVWAQSLVQTFYDHPAAGIVAGKVELKFIASPPHWVRGPFLNYLSRLDMGPHCREIEKNEWITGANFAVRRDVFDRVGLFDEGIGMMGRDPALAGNDEIELKRRVRSRTDYQVVYQPRALVHHVIAGDRLTREYFESRRYGQGRADFILDRAHGRLRTNDAAYRNLRRRLEQAYAYFSADGPGDDSWRDCHRSSYFRCLIAYACGFHHAVLKHIDQSGIEPGREYDRGCETAAFFRANDCNDAVLLMEMQATLMSLVRDAGSAPAREQWVRRCLNYLDGLMFGRIRGAIAESGGQPVDSRGVTWSRTVANLVMAPPDVHAAVPDMRPGVSEPCWRRPESEVSVIVLNRRREMSRVTATLVRRQPAGDSVLCLPYVLRRAGLSAAAGEFISTAVGSYDILGAESRRPQLERREDVAALCDCVGRCLAIGVSAGEQAAHADRFRATRHYWLNGVHKLQRICEEQVGIATAVQLPRNLAAAVAAAHDRLSGFPSAWQPLVATRLASYRVSAEDGRARLVSSAHVSLRSRFYSAAALAKHLPERQCFLSRSELTALILSAYRKQGGDELDAHFAFTELTWCEVAVMLDRLCWAISGPGAETRPVARAPDTIGLSQFISDLERALSATRSAGPAE